MGFRPDIDNDYLIVGAPLYGGTSYSLLKNFFVDVMGLFVFEAQENIFEIMNNVASSESKNTKGLVTDTCFLGTRKEPNLRGSISSISLNNFNAGSPTVAIIKVIAKYSEEAAFCAALFASYNASIVKTV